MTTTTRTTLILALLVMACDEGQTETPTPATPEASEQAAAEPEGEPDPCALLTEAVLRSTFEIPDATELENRPSTNARRASCAYTWDKPNAEELRVEIARLRAERMQEMMAGAARGERGQNIADLMDLPSANNRVSLNFAPSSESAEAARAQFVAGGERLAAGITRSLEVDDDAEGESVTFQASFETVDGVGDAARWTPRLDQLAVLHGTQTLYINVGMDADKAVNLERATQLAHALID